MASIIIIFFAVVPDIVNKSVSDTYIAFLININLEICDISTYKVTLADTVKGNLIFGTFSLVNFTGLTPNSTYQFGVKVILPNRQEVIIASSEFQTSVGRMMLYDPG